MALTEEGLIHVPGLLSRWVRLANGARAHYMTAGETGPSVILLHGGFAGSSGTAGWRYAAPFLGANGFRVYCPDLPGFGLSDVREEHWPTGLGSHVDYLQHFADALCVERFHLAGNSMGCIDSVNFLCAHPNRVLSYALIAGFVGDVAPLQVEPKVNPAVLASFDGTEESMRRMMETIIGHDEAIDDELIAMRTATARRTEQSRAALGPAMLMYALGMGDDAEAVRLTTRGRLDRLPTPGICIYGQDDGMVPVEQGHLQEDALPGIQFFYPDDCGHQAQTDQPDMINHLLLEFFRDGRVGRKTADWAGVSSRRPENAALVEAP